MQTRSHSSTSDIIIRPRHGHNGTSPFPDPNYLMKRLATFPPRSAAICTFPP
ncbi:unnamed protein product [Penicillium roqueforti FM164]|uniref:Genomic scaffold, ProqFM164S03 n=1 Tax=Penicillium roqueforti (strain FM164) TaxID=1365484 RepID=W6QX58_PENRF|nr:unnamed protein product [Penicillium roqueforti FM164]